MREGGRLARLDQITALFIWYPPGPGNEQNIALFIRLGPSPAESRMGRTWKVLAGHVATADPPPV